MQSVRQRTYRVPGSNHHQMGKVAVHADLLDDGIDRRRAAVRTRARQWRAYALAERGPSNAQMMRPSKGSSSTSTIQSALWPVGAPLCAIFTIAHTSRIRISTPKIPPTLRSMVIQSPVTQM